MLCRRSNLSKHHYSCWGATLHGSAVWQSSSVMWQTGNALACRNPEPHARACLQLTRSMLAAAWSGCTVTAKRVRITSAAITGGMRMFSTPGCKGSHAPATASTLMHDKGINANSIRRGADQQLTCVESNASHASRLLHRFRNGCDMTWRSSQPRHRSDWPPADSHTPGWAAAEETTSATTHGAELRMC
jgi:hypothetical protein